jgi:hypothetical protein
MISILHTFFDKGFEIFHRRGNNVATADSFGDDEADVAAGTLFVG